MMRTVTPTLRKIIGLEKLMPKEFTTVLWEVVAMVIPGLSLTYHRHRKRVLTPAHFMTGEGNTSIPFNQQVILSSSKATVKKMG